MYGLILYVVFIPVKLTSVFTVDIVFNFVWYQEYYVDYLCDKLITVLKKGKKKKYYVHTGLLQNTVIKLSGYQ